MKRIALVAALLLLGAAAGAAAASDTFVVGIEQSSKDSWQTLANDFQTVTGIAVSIQPIPQNSIAQQVALQALTHSGRLNFIMVASASVSGLARYVEDLSSLASTFSAKGITPVTQNTKVVGVPIAFAPGWYLSVLSWPKNQSGAGDFLVAAALGTASSSASTPEAASAQSLAATFTKGKLTRSQHSPKFDGALDSLIAAAQSGANAMSAAGSSLQSATLAALDTIAGVFGVPFSEQTGMVTVVMESSPGKSASSNASALRALGVPDASIDASSSLIKVTVPVGQLSSLVSQLSGVAYVRAPYEPYARGTIGEGRAAIGADAYNTGGVLGAGVKIAVIDLGFSGLAQAQARGDLPMSVVQNDLTGTGLTSGISHGTAVAEVIYDIAPSAELTLIKIGDEVDLDQAVTYCLANGIDIINHSLGWYNTSNYDGTGTIADMARRAITGGILWVNAAGNEAQSHWRGTFADANSDGWNDTSITFYTSSGSPIVTFLTWNEWPAASTDYDLYLYDPSSNMLASSAKYQTGTEEPTESISTTATATGTYTLRIHGTGARSLSLFNLYQAVSPAVAATSILTPADVTEVVAVGAINVANYTAGPQAAYSSQGPTTDGRAKPDLVCPDNVATGTAPYTAFAGTSGAAPHASAAAALLLSLQPSLTGTALRAQLVANTVAMGSPNIYGQGRLVLQPLAAPNQSPVAAFSASSSPAAVGQSVTFSSSGSYDPDGTIVSWSWNFGDGSTASGNTPTHAYGAAGTYTITLTVQDNGGATGSIAHSLTVNPAANQPPAASFTAMPSPALVGQTVTFNGTGSYDPDGSVVSWSWSFGDGYTGSGSTPTHAYGAAGTYTITLTVQDNGGATGSIAHSLTVNAPTNQPPVASFTTSPSPALVGQPVAFAASASFDPDGSIVYYGWSFGDGGTGSGVSASHAYSAPGTYTATLTVQDNAGATAGTTRQVAVQAPSYPDLAILSFTSSPAAPTVGQSLTFSVVVINQGTAAAGSFRVRLNGASLSTTATVSSLSAGATRAMSLVLPLTATSETYTLFVDDLSQVAESNESNNIQSLTVTATTPAPVAHAGGPYSGTAGSAITFSGTGSTGAITSYVWSFGDGYSTSGATVLHSYAAAGTYLVTLTVTGPGGSSSDTTQAVVGSPLPALAATLSLPKSTYIVGEAVTMTVSLNRSAYVYICEVTPDHRVVLIFPSLYEPSNLLPAGSKTIPGGAYTLRASEPTGSETLILFAATGPISGFPTSFGSGFPVLSTNPVGFQASTLAAMQASYAASDRTTTSAPLTTQAAAPTTGTLRVRSTPTGATVRVNGSVVGTTNLDLTNVTPGTYTVEVSLAGYQTATQSATVTAGSLTTVQVALTALPVNQSPVAAFTYSPTSPNAGVLVQFDASASYDPDGTVISYAWNFGDGGTGTGALVTHAYMATGSYTAQLVVTDNGGATAQVARTVTVIPSDDVGWVSPIAYTEATGKWKNPELCFDNDLTTRAYVSPGTNTWSPDLLLTLPGSGVLSNRVRIYVSDWSPVTTHYFTWAIDALVDGTWVQVYSAIPVEKQWVEAAFTQGTVTQLRVRTLGHSGGDTRLWEIDVHDSTVGP